MKNLLPVILIFIIAACSNDDRKAPASENDIDAARNFIQASLEGKYDRARTYMLTDSINDDRMTMIESRALQAEERQGLAQASINIHNVNRVDDSTTIVIYSNSFKNNWDTLKVVRLGAEWLVDFNYLFEHDKDTINFPLKTDSIP